MNRVTRGEKVLNSLVEQGTISRCGADWLIAAIDPFHDKQLANLQGWPDLESGASVVRCIKQSVTIARPSTVPNTDNWDCHIVSWPWLNTGPVGFCGTSTRAGQTYTYSNAAPVAQIGGLQAYGMAAGADLDILQAGTVRIVGQLNIDPQYTHGAGRLVGAGFEVHNTTATITQQGAACVYRMMASNPHLTTWIGQISNIEPIPVNIYSGPLVRFPPKNLAQALLLSGSRQWEAREGCYVVSAFNDCENPAYPIQPMCPVISASAVDDVEGAANVSALNVIRVVTDNGLGYCPVPEIRVHPIHQSGAIFTGLSPTTTLTLNWNVYYETFPGLAQLDILPLASPSCEYDPDALDLFERILQDLPVGVKVKENGLGDWFLGAVSDAAKFLSPAIGLIPHPIAQGASALLKYAGETAGSYAKPPMESQSPWKAEDTRKLMTPAQATAMQRRLAAPVVVPKKKKKPKKPQAAKKA